MQLVRAGHSHLFRRFAEAVHEWWDFEPWAQWWEGNKPLALEVKHAGSIVAAEVEVVRLARAEFDAACKKSRDESDARLRKCEDKTASL